MRKFSAWGSACAAASPFSMCSQPSPLPTCSVFYTSRLHLPKGFSPPWPFPSNSSLCRLASSSRDHIPGTGYLVGLVDLLMAGHTRMGCRVVPWTLAVKGLVPLVENLGGI